jgi:hypothetical protein
VSDIQRLVYSPKVYAFVKTDQYPVGLDISDYVVRGNVHRRVNAVSSATLELRNPNQLWTAPGRPLLHPMDPITIFLTRLRGRPVQVFTGYLDTTPYLQLFPGTVTVQASCTLKRLQHTYWDPALRYSLDFMRKNGWIVDQKDGVMQSLAQVTVTRTPTTSTTVLSADCCSRPCRTLAGGTRQRSTSRSFQRASSRRPTRCSRR